MMIHDAKYRQTVPVQAIQWDAELIVLTNNTVHLMTAEIEDQVWRTSSSLQKQTWWYMMPNTGKHDKYTFQ